MIRLTPAQVAGLKPCSNRADLFGGRKSMNARQAFAAGASISDLCWVAGKLGRKDLLVRFALKCAQSVAHLSSDPSTQASLDAVQNWIDRPSAETKAASWAASEAASMASWTSWVASRAASRAASLAASWASRAASLAASEEAYRAASLAASWASWATPEEASRAASKNQHKLWFIEIFDSKDS